jgi:hypothetical protein
MKIPALSIVSTLGVLLALTSARAVDYQDFNAPNDTYPDGSTVITGIRGASEVPGDVVITASYVTGVNDETLPAIYSGSLLTNNPAGWHILTPTFSDNRVVTTSTLYGPNTTYYDSSLDGDIRAVGSYKYTGGGSGNHGLMYVGPVDGVGGTWSTIDVPSNINGGNQTILNTIVHSTMGNYAVGNYDIQLDEGIAFVYDIANNSYANLTPVQAESITAYGIWENADGTYTVAGGYSDLNRLGADAGYLALYDSTFSTVLDVKKYQYEDEPLSAFISHFDGIVGVNGGYNLTGDQINLTTNEQFGFFASVQVVDGKFTTASWESIVYPGSTATSGNTVYGNSVLGVYAGEDGSSSYIATVPEPATGLLLIGGIGAMFFARRRSAVQG